ncbi:tRNA(Ile)-lysidine synthase [Caloramator mitchellensis]|uniref:tRNA(Ile)-lysidine synthase n=1 Tax=Caloramator mitchellensis TaxID=908809 RepID=A0A0R3JT33_CALMK|nr:tRNA lysidine(34) synthetase TilS [Caloramator mitchellensis]KRQ86672.1 tRNA(Ile)-lysidine synthase [Caloramator mitchellensis]
MIDKVLGFIKKNKMIECGDKIVVGFSGGPDSTALLHVLDRLKEELNIEIFAVHINHMIRGEEASRDEEFSRKFCKRFNIPFYSFRIDVLKMAKEMGLSSEEAGRVARYDSFDMVLRKVGANKIALAHNKNDQAETVIMKFLRGAGLKGISGISPVRDNIIRPILICTREEIEKYCIENALNPVIDSTNEEAIYLRNKVRLQLMPYIKENINENIIDSLFRMADIFRDEEGYMETQSINEFKRLNRDGWIEIDSFLNLHIALKRRIIRHMIKEVKGDLNAIENIHIEECLNLIQRNETGKSVILPKGLVGEISYGRFRIKISENKDEVEYKLEIPGEIYSSEFKIKVVAEIIEINENLIETQFIKFFDYDKIKGDILLRNRREGDFIYPKGMNGRKKLKDLFIDKKIQKDERDRIPLIAINNEILWAYNIRDTKNYKIDNNTKRVLKIKIERG